MEYDYSNFVLKEGENNKAYLQIIGITCSGCIIKIENALKKQRQIKSARINFSTNRLSVVWYGEKNYINEIVNIISKLGYSAQIFEYNDFLEKEQKRQKSLLIAIGIAAFASSNIMLFSVALWAGYFEGIGENTKNLFNWLSMLIGVPAILYCGKTFFESAIKSLKNFSSNIDVPISIGIILTTLISVQETLTNGKYIYFDSAIMLELFLLVGRFFEAKALSNAKSYAANLLSSENNLVKLIKEDGGIILASVKQIKAGDAFVVPKGEKFLVDCNVLEGESELDTSQITGEAFPQKVQVNSNILAGSINLGQQIKVVATKTYENSFIANLIKIVEEAESKKDKFSSFSAKTIKIYTPVVNILAIATFLGWFFIAGLSWQQASLIAVSVLIITCPCGLGLAVPVAHTVASSVLFKNGILRKSGDALERIYNVNSIVFDKTGTLTLGKLKLENEAQISIDDIKLASSMASSSNHVISRAIFGLYDNVKPIKNIKEIPGKGIEAKVDGKKILLGSSNFVGEDNEDLEKIVVYLKKQNEKPIKFIFSDSLKQDAKQVVSTLKESGYNLYLISGDSEANTKKIAKEVSIENYYFNQLPSQKLQLVNGFVESGQKVLMVGDGVNDLPAIAASLASVSFYSGSEITQKTSDFIIKSGSNLSPILFLIKLSKKTIGIIKQNIAISVIYNIITVPIAMAGLVNPMFAAIIMSVSSLTVIINSFRINKLKNENYALDR